MRPRLHRYVAGRGWAPVSLSCLSVAVVSLTGVILIGGPIGSAFPSGVAVGIGGMLAIIGIATLLRTPSHGRCRTATTTLLGTLPLAGFAGLLYASPSLAHLTTHTSELGWVLAATLPLTQALAHRRASGKELSIDGTYGGCVGIACAVLLNLAIAGESFGLPWALAGWTTGAALVSGLMQVTPRPATRLPFGIGLRAVPTAAAWIMAIIVAAPATPRHELATSAGAQALALLVSGWLALTVYVLWQSERLSSEQDSWQRFRLTMRSVAPTIAVLALLLVGAFQAASYSAATADDLGHFWYSADALINGSDYPVWGDWMSLPVLPLLLIASFAAFGHTYPAALAPMFLANLLLPWLLFRASRSVGASHTLAFSVAVLATVLPPIQIDSLGSAEPDPVFIALLAATAWAFACVLRDSRPHLTIPALGFLAAALALTRPEGLLYGGLVLLATLAAKRSWLAITATLGTGVLLMPLAIYSLRTTGRPWPTMGQEFSLENLVNHAGLVGGVTWPKVARVVLLDDLRFPVLIAAILALSAWGSVCLVRRSAAFAALPVAVVINVLVTLGISASTVRPEEPHEFVRHIAYPTPVVATLAAAGASALAARAARSNSRFRRLAVGVGVAAATYLTAGSLYVLATPEEFHHGNRSGSLLADNIYVNAPELWQNPLPLPCPPCLPEGEWSFDAFRRDLFAWYEPFDNHSNSAGAAYQTLTGTAAAAGLVALLTAAPARLSGSKQRPPSSVRQRPRKQSA